MWGVYILWHQWNKICQNKKSKLLKIEPNFSSGLPSHLLALCKYVSQNYVCSNSLNSRTFVQNILESKCFMCEVYLSVKHVLVENRLYQNEKMNNNIPFNFPYIFQKCSSKKTFYKKPSCYLFLFVKLVIPANNEMVDAVFY